jgi:galactosamine-6-phosphate isomerase
MRIHYFSDFKEMSQAGFQIVKTEIESKPNLLFCVASGGSPSGLYAEMAKEKSQNPAFCEQLRVVKLDEWGGMEEGSEATSEVDVRTKFILPLEIAPDRYWGADPFTSDPYAECGKMESTIQNEGPIDICILGIGVNGHIALNEPSEKLTLGFHVCQLAETTLNNGMLKSLKQPPSFGMTMGIGNILESKRILLFFSGSGKKEAFQRLLMPGITTQFPASLLWIHPNVDVLVDRNSI